MDKDDKAATLEKEYPPIFGKDKSGKTRVWKATVFSFKASNAMSVIQHGIYDGKLQVDSRQYTEGKNIGKKNETTPLQQCIAEVEKKRKDKIEKEGYSETFPGRESTISDSSAVSNDLRISSSVGDTPAFLRNPTGLRPSGFSSSSQQSARKIFPMLANKYEPATSLRKRGGIVFPCFVQPKLDGLRCVVYLVNGAPVYQSRTGGAFTVLQHLDASIQQILSQNPTLVLDGELYTRQIPFEELAGIIKKKTLTETDKQKIRCVQYHVYDLILPGVPFRERLAALQQVISLSGTFVTPVLTHLANGSADFKEKFSEYVAQGYEGIMLRNTEGLYQENYRSNDLMKYKEFFESEYKIVDFKEAVGRDAGTVIWECETPEGRRFSVRPRGTKEARREWFSKGASLVGKQLTVIYQELSEMGVPRFPVGKAIRDGY